MLFVFKRCANAVLLSLVMNSVMQAGCPLAQSTASASASTAAALKRYEKLLIKYLPYHIGKNGKALGAIAIAVPLAVLLRAQILCALAAKYAADQHKEAGVQSDLQELPEASAPVAAPSMSEKEKQDMIRLAVAFGAGALTVGIPVLISGSSSK